MAWAQVAVVAKTAGITALRGESRLPFIHDEPNQMQGTTTSIMKTLQGKSLLRVMIKLF